MDGKAALARSVDIAKNEKARTTETVGKAMRGLIEEKTGIETRFSSLDYIQRGGTPVAYDRSLATAFGVKAVALVQQKKYGEMTALIGNRITSTPLAEVADGIKTVYLNAYRIAERFFG